MKKVIENNHAHHVARDAQQHHARRPALLRYVVARQLYNGPELFCVPLRSGEEALPVFSSMKSAQNFIFSNAFGWEWYARECSAGELISLLLGPYASVDWVVLDPLPGCLVAGDDPANMTRWG